MKKILKILALIPVFFYLFPSPALAICPICTLAIGAGLGLSRFLGVDDTISGLWIGGLTLSFSMWLTTWITKKYQPKFKTIYITLASIILNYSLIFLPLHFMGVLGHPFNKILGIDKLIFGAVIGSLLFLLALLADKKVREIKGKQLFKYEKVVFPVSILAIASLIFYFITRVKV
jgi:hypothetical protein